MMRVWLTVLLTFGGMIYSFREAAAGEPQFWLGVSLPYVLLVAVALQKMWQDGSLVERLTPRWGDLSIGALSMIGLLFASWAARRVLSPAGSPRQAWLFRIYLQLGNPEHLQRSTAFTLLILTLSAAEEIVWRGMVLAALSARFGRRAALPLSALLYGAAMLPSLWLLRDPSAGLNPLLITAAVGCGLVWSFLAAQLGRLSPVIISHMAFTYFTVVQFRLPGL
jgi:membrane protease YdiL (CAAX protease family)